MKYVQSITTEHVGGGLECDIIYLNDGTVLSISDDTILLYPDRDAYERGEGSEGKILRPLGEK